MASTHLVEPRCKEAYIISSANTFSYQQVVNMPRDDIRSPVSRHFDASYESSLSIYIFIAQKWDITTGIPDLTGKVAIVTGAK